MEFLCSYEMPIVKLKNYYCTGFGPFQCTRKNGYQQAQWQPCLMPDQFARQPAATPGLAVIITCHSNRRAFHIISQKFNSYCTEIPCFHMYIVKQFVLARIPIPIILL